MSETFPNVAQQPVVEQGGIFSRLAESTRARYAAVVLAGTFAIAGCSGNNEVSPSPTTSEQSELFGACDPENVDLDQNLADSKFAERQSLFPSLKVDGVPVSAAEAAKITQEQALGDANVLAVLSEVYAKQAAKEAPNGLTVSGINEQVNTLLSNDEYAARKATEVCGNLAFLGEPETVAVVSGNATEISFVRGEKDGENGVVAGVQIETITQDRTINAYSVGTNLVVEGLTETDKVFFEQFADQVFISADTGTIIIIGISPETGTAELEEYAEQIVAPREEAARQAAAEQAAREAAEEAARQEQQNQQNQGGSSNTGNRSSGGGTGGSGSTGGGTSNGGGGSNSGSGSGGSNGGGGSGSSGGSGGGTGGGSNGCGTGCGTGGSGGGSEPAPAPKPAPAPAPKPTPAPEPVKPPKVECDPAIDVCN